MRITTQAEWEAYFAKRSLILNRPKNDPKRPPKFSQVYDFTREGIELMLQDRVGENGSLAYYRQQVKDAVRAWETYSSRQPIKQKKPVGAWLEVIEKGRARVKTIEAECRELNKILEAQRSKEEKVKETVFKRRGIIKMKDNVMFNAI